jgi:hypothetical protein
LQIADEIVRRPSRSYEAQTEENSAERTDWSRNIPDVKKAPLTEDDDSRNACPMSILAIQGKPVARILCVRNALLRMAATGANAVL